MQKLTLMDSRWENSSWEDFVKNQLLQSGLINGICLFSKLRAVLYTYGNLANTSQDDSEQFLQHFVHVNDETSKTLDERGFHLNLQDGQSTSFHIHSRTMSSIHATGAGNQAGLLVGNLPYGVLLCTFDPSHHSAQNAIKQFEQVCGLLRS